MKLVSRIALGLAGLSFVAACSGETEDVSGDAAAAPAAEEVAAVPDEDFPDTEQFATCVERNTPMVDTGENVEGRVAQTIFGFHVPADGSTLPETLPASLQTDYPTSLTELQEQFTIADVNEMMRDGFFDPGTARVMYGPEWSYVLISPPETTTQAAANLDLKRACARETEAISLQLITIKRAI